MTVFVLWDVNELRSAVVFENSFTTPDSAISGHIEMEIEVADEDGVLRLVGDQQVWENSLLVRRFCLLGGGRYRIAKNTVVFWFLSCSGGLVLEANLNCFK